tara:strand:+ start:18731 stop:19015 length:285 start_codon:yes stop_codon:yes gene_type:complete
MKKNVCPVCEGHLVFEPGHMSYNNQGMFLIHAENRIVCLMCARYRYLDEYKGCQAVMGRTSALPHYVLEYAPEGAKEQTAAAERRAQYLLTKSP